ncbi:autotransporter domain-containing protein [Sebaldella sp. S0638]|uniref:autotransporter domain-containing protein n=1 Tax=Sebaldella sp. S0638 TaxID=2957809 RepID=UPI0020A198D7|nr:autotransporter outer membrane beta-barrel domain-containing protein [Sebaldella sp. S0638]MCP1225815.1 autotransporter domain-containing protein [Sebaldella sp. S0638]
MTDINADNTNETNNSTENIIMMANDYNNLGSKKTFVENKAVITIGKNLEQTTGLLAANGGNLVNSGTIIVNSGKSQGIAVLGSSSSSAEASGTNSGNVTVSGDKAAGVYNAGSFNMNSGIINVSGNQSIGVYSAKNNNKTNLNGGKIVSSNGAVNLYTGENAAVNLTGTSLTANDSGLLFYTYADAWTNVSTGHVKITGTANAEVNSGGTAFYLRGGLSDITGFINSIFTGNGVLNLNMTDSNSALFILKGSDSAVNLSQSGADIIEALIPSSKVQIQGQDYKIYSAVRGNLAVDQNVNLDDTGDTYNRTEYLSSKVKIESGVIMSGSADDTYAAAQKNYTGTSGRDEVTVRNNGTILLSGKNSVGIIMDFGIITNDGVLIVSGDNSIGLLGGNGSQIKNTGYIEAGNNGVGIYGTNLLTSETPDYGNKKIEIINDGIIKVNGAEKGAGIYSDNSNADILTSDSAVTLGENSVIDISGAKKGTGIYSKRSVLNGRGQVIAGSESTGIYLDSSNAVMNDIEIVLNGNNSAGVDLAGNSDLSGTIIFNVNGNNNILFNLVSLTPANSFINFDMAKVSGNGNYTGGNMKNSGFYFSNETMLSNKSILAAGENSVILFDENAVITADGNNIAGFAGGKYLGNELFIFTGKEISSDVELVNKGTVILQDNSAGLYAKNGAGSLNTGNIEVHKNSAAMFGENVDNLLNSGKITIGENSKGIYIKEGKFTSSVNNGTISGNSNSSAGIYSDYNGGNSSFIKNEGMISLAGMKSAGIYVKGSGIQNVDNSGEITIGDSADNEILSVGIYNDNKKNTIVNNGKISTGKNSAGIYSKGGSITGNGILETGAGGIGIFTAGGNVLISNTGIIKTGTDSASGIYAIDNALVENHSENIEIGKGSFGFVLESGSGLDNTAALTLHGNNVLIYGSGAGTITNSGDIQIDGSENVLIYTIGGGTVKNAGDITVISGKGNIGIYNEGGSILNNGDISTGDSDIIYSASEGIDSAGSRYSIAILGNNSTVKNYGDINLGENTVGIYVMNNQTAAENHGNITSSRNGAVGIYSDSGSGVINYGTISLYGDNVIGIAGINSGKITNEGIISVEGENAAGIYSTQNVTVENKGTINVSGKNSAGITAPVSKIINSGTINFSDGARMTSSQSNYEIPELVNAGIIKVNGEFDALGMKISIKPNIDTIQKSVLSGVDFTLDSVSILADSIKVTDTIKILPDFTQGTNANVYKLENVFKAGSLTVLGNKLSVVSSSFTWEAVSEEDEERNTSIYMKKLAYHDFAKGLWFDGLAQALDKNYYGADGNAGIIYDKIDLITSEDDFRHVMASLGGSVYANINQREEDVARAFEQSAELMSDSVNTTKESVKINVIAGKGRTTEKTAGVESYDYTTAGVLALREVERTYKHTFGYSLGYLHTGFEFQDGNNSEERVDTVQIGIHNKYKADGWRLRNDLTGRIGFHNIDRNIVWSETGRSEMNGLYETYSMTSDNVLGKEVRTGKKVSLIPYGAFRAMYVTRPSFTEKGLESVKVHGNDAWSVKPRAGIEVDTSVPLGRKSEWKLKGKLDFAYEYEFLDLNEKEQAKLTAIETNYHDLAKPEREKGSFRGKALIGMEIEERYGVFLNGEYMAGSSKENDYRAGVTLKAVF